MEALAELKKVVARLRAPDGCPWDQEQTHQSLAPCLVEECAEVLEAIDRDDAELLREELGDVLLSVFMHAEIAEEAGRFDLRDVAEEIVSKLIRRHPHVFGPEARQTTTGAVLQRWEEIKAAEKAAKGVEAGDPPKIVTNGCSGTDFFLRKRMPRRVPVWRQVWRMQKPVRASLSGLRLVGRRASIQKGPCGGMRQEYVTRPDRARSERHCPVGQRRGTNLTPASLKTRRPKDERK